MFFRTAQAGLIHASKVVNGHCGVCKSELTERYLTHAEFETLRSSFANYLQDGCDTGKLGSKVEFHALQRMIGDIRAKSKYG
jgi:hypothetical protein